MESMFGQIRNPIWGIGSVAKDMGMGNGRVLMAESILGSSRTTLSAGKGNSRSMMVGK